MTALFDIDELSEEPTKKVHEEEKKEILCKTCLNWINCGGKNELKGFCLGQKLFTYTAKTECEDYFEDDSISSEND